MLEGESTSIMSFFGRLRKSTKPKVPVIDECTDHCCYVNTAYAAPSLSEASSNGRSIRANGSLKSRPTLTRGETFTMKDGPPDDNLPELLNTGTYSKKKG